MQSATQPKGGKTATTRCYVRFYSPLIPDSVSLVINKKPYLLQKDPASPDVYQGQIDVVNKQATAIIRFELTGTATGNGGSVTADIRLWQEDVNLGSYPAKALVSKNRFKAVIGELTPGEERLEEISRKKKAATTKVSRSKSSDDSLRHTNIAIDGDFGADDSGFSGGIRKNNINIDKEKTLPPQPTKKTNPKEDPGGVVTVFYGTNRSRATGEKTVAYGSGLGALEQGLCTVSIPPGHKQGAIERPGKILWLIPQKENANKHIVLTSVKPMPDTDYYSYLKQSIGKADSKAALIFVHGFNVTFEEAAWRCGQIAYDIPFSGITGFFSWPSAGDLPDYGRDVERAEASVTCLTDFIENLVKNTDVKELHFIGHSMGNRVLTKALNQLVQRASFVNSVTSIAQVVLAAPDIDDDVFDKEIYPVFKNIGRRRTLYTSDQDIALIVSKDLRRGLRRVGQAGDGIYVVDGLDTIDASNVASKGIHHSYIFEEKELLTDLNTLLRNGVGPLERGLAERMKTEKDKSLKYWLFKE